MMARTYLWIIFFSGICMLSSCSKKNHPARTAQARKFGPFVLQPIECREFVERGDADRKAGLGHAAALYPPRRMTPSDKGTESALIARRATTAEPRTKDLLIREA